MPTRVRTRGLPLTEEEITQIACERFAGGGAGGFTSIEVLAKRHGGRNPSVISRAIAKAFREGFVEVVPVLRGKRPSLDGELGTRLQERYPSLSAALVIEEQEGPGIRVYGPVEHAELQRSDDLHESLGEALAAHVLDHGKLRDWDRVGLGSGRGVYSTVRAFLRRDQLKLKGISLLSLTGFSYTGYHRRDSSYLTDADINTIVFSQCFEQPVSLKLMKHPFVYPDEATTQQLRSLTWLGEEWAEQRVIDIAMVGVGTLSSGHRFYEEALRPTNDREPVYQRIFEALRQLVEVSKRFEGSGYYPVADIANRLFFVPPPKTVPLDDATQSSIRKTIDQINDKLHTVSLAQLCRVQGIFLVAGTARKAGAIRELLANAELPIRVLCTDAETARRVLAD